MQSGIKYPCFSVAGWLWMLVISQRRRKLHQCTEVEREGCLERLACFSCMECLFLRLCGTWLRLLCFQVTMCNLEVSCNPCDLTVVPGLLFPPHSGLFWATLAMMKLPRVFFYFSKHRDDIECHFKNLNFDSFCGVAWRIVFFSTLGSLCGPRGWRQQTLKPNA